MLHNRHTQKTQKVVDVEKQSQSRNRTYAHLGNTETQMLYKYTPKDAPQGQNPRV